MRRIATAIIASGFAVAALPALASDRLSDSAYIAAARCQGALGAASSDALKTLVKEQRVGRDNYILDQAKDARRAAAKQAAKGGGVADARCSRYAQKSGGAMAAGNATTTAR